MSISLSCFQFHWTFSLLSVKYKNYLLYNTFPFGSFICLSSIYPSSIFLPYVSWMLLPFITRFLYAFILIILGTSVIIPRSMLSILFYWLFLSLMMSHAVLLLLCFISFSLEWTQFGIEVGYICVQKFKVFSSVELNLRSSSCWNISIYHHHHHLAFVRFRSFIA